MRQLKPGAVWKSSEGDTAPSATKRAILKVTQLSHHCWSTGSSANCQTVGGSSSKFQARNLFGGVLHVCESESDILIIPEWSLWRCLNSRLCHRRWLNWIVSFSVDLLLQTLLWPLLLGLYGSAAVAIFGGSGRLWSHLCMRCRLTVLVLF